MNDRNQRLQRTGKESRKRALTGVLYVTAILYFVIQWKFVSRIGPNKIFSASRKTDQVDFAMMIDSMSNAARRECNTGNLNTLLLNDSEIAVPYIETKGDRRSGCTLIRETSVTPFSQIEMNNCHVIDIREYGPTYTDPSAEVALRTDDAMHTTRPWILMDRWVSNDRRFGFALYRHPCSAENDVKWK